VAATLVFVKKQNDHRKFAQDEVSPMINVRVTEHIGGSANELFDFISDHEAFLGRYPGMRARIVTPGRLERDGLGCVREVLVGRKIRYLEEITEWSRPSSFEYMIREASMPIRHYGSRLEFSDSGGGTNITWTSHFDVPVPLIGWVVGLYMKSQYQAAFQQLLKNARSAFDQKKTDRG
jgi:hypothetical protein